MNFNNRLERVLISELFDRDDFEGISKQAGFSSVIYRFSDGTTEYSIECAIVDLGYDSGLKVHSVDLIAGHDIFRPTGRGNFGFVYSKLLACLRDLILNEGSGGLSFVGFNSGMDLVYNKMINRFAKSDDPRLRFHGVGRGLWLSDWGISQLNDEDRAVVIDKIKNFDDSGWLKGKKEHRIKERQAKLVKRNFKNKLVRYKGRLATVFSVFQEFGGDNWLMKIIFIDDRIDIDVPVEHAGDLSLVDPDELSSEEVAGFSSVFNLFNISYQ